MTAARCIVAIVLVLFAWKGSSLSIPWPQDSSATIQSPRPPAEILALAEPLRQILPKMLPKDRVYLSSFYDAMAFVLLRDGTRQPPIIGTTDQFAIFHAGSLRLAIDKSAVGKYPGLAEAIDETIIRIAGADSRNMDDELRGKLIVACSTLSWTFGIHGDE